jgi:hypothetical protein
LFVNSPEAIKKKIQEIFSLHFRTHLDSVSALWEDDPIELVGYDDIFLGSATRTKEIKSWPSLAILSSDVYATEVSQQGKVITWNTQVYLRTYLRDSNVARLDKTLDRYLQAQLHMFDSYPASNLDGMAKSLDFMRYEPTSSILPTGASIFIRGMETQWEVRHR